MKKKTKAKNPAAVAMAKLRAQKLSPERRSEIAAMGGAVGGTVRASRMSASERSQSAKKAAEARWGKKAAK